jgi:hypothetical protein
MQELSGVSEAARDLAKARFPLIQPYLEERRSNSDWVEPLLRYLPDKNTVDDVLQSFQGAVLPYLITDNPEPEGACMHET